jgi:hypothetical protein
VLEVVGVDDVSCWSTPEAIWVVWCIPFNVINVFGYFITDPSIWVVVEFFTFITEEALEIAVLGGFVTVVNGGNAKDFRPLTFSGISVS